MEKCKDDHEQVFYTGKECPVCRIRLQLDEVLDAKTDIEEADIFDIYDELKYVQRRLKRIENHTGLQPMRRKWWQRNKDTVRVSAERTQSIAPAEATF